MALASESDIRRAYSEKSVAEQYVANRFASELHRMLHSKQVAAVQQVIDVTRPKRTLEIAPGPGRVTRDIRPTGSLVALEFNEEMIKQGQAACSLMVNWIRGDGFQLPFRQSEFDFVYSFRFIRHFHREDRNRLYTGIRNALAKDGHFIMDAVNAKPSAPLREKHPEDYPIYDKLYSADELESELKEAGFTDIRLRPVQKCFAWQYRSQVLLGPRAAWANRFVIRALEQLPIRDGLEWIVTCRRA